MSKKQPDLPPPGSVDALLIRIEQLEKWQAAFDGALRAFFVVYGIGRLPDPPDQPGGHG